MNTMWGKETEAYNAGVAAERERSARVASMFTMKSGRSIHPNIKWEDMSEAAQVAAHTTAQQIADLIRSGDAV